MGFHQTNVNNGMISISILAHGGVRKTKQRYQNVVEKHSCASICVCVCELLVNLGLWGHIFLVDAKVGTSVWVLTEKHGVLRYEI